MTEKTTTDAVIDAALGWRARAAKGDDPRLWADVDDFALIEAVDALLAEQAEAVQTLIDDSTRAFAAADTSSERVEVIRDLLAGWYAAWPETAVTDEHEGIAWQLASLISAAEARASTSDAGQAREQLLAELTGGQRPCPWCDGAPVFDSREDLLTHARRHHFDAPYPAAEMVWLGDLSGYWIEAPDHEHPMLRHRCGWAHEITSPVRGYLANLLTGPASAHRDAGCNPHEG